MALGRGLHLSGLVSTPVKWDCTSPHLARMMHGLEKTHVKSLPQSRGSEIVALVTLAVVISRGARGPRNPCGLGSTQDLSLRPQSFLLLRDIHLHGGTGAAHSVLLAISHLCVPGTKGSWNRGPCMALSPRQDPRSPEPEGRDLDWTNMAEHGSPEHGWGGGRSQPGWTMLAFCAQTFCSLSCRTRAASTDEVVSRGRVCRGCPRDPHAPCQGGGSARGEPWISTQMDLSCAWASDSPSVKWVEIHCPEHSRVLHSLSPHLLCA